MTDLFANPAIQSCVLPFILALCMAAAVGVSKASTARYAGLAVALSFLVAYGITFGLPPFPANTSGQKIAYIAALAAVLGLSIEHWRTRFARQFALALGLVCVATVWIGWRKLAAAPTNDHLFALSIIAGAALALFATLRPPKDANDPAVALLVVCLSFAVLAFLGASASIAQNAAALGAALGGVLILNWPRRRVGLSASARLVPVVILAALAAQTVFFTKVPAWALALLLPAFFADRLAFRWLPADGLRSALVRPMILVLSASLLVTPALAAAWYVSSSSALEGGY